MRMRVHADGTGCGCLTGMSLLLRHLISPVWPEGVGGEVLMSVPGLQLRNGILELLCKLPAAEICKVGHENDGASCLWSRLQCRGRMLMQVPYAQCMGNSTKDKKFYCSYGKASSERDDSLPREKQ